MIGPPPVVPIQTSALMVCPPAVRVACVPFANVGHDPLATGRSGGGVPPSAADPPLLDPLEPPEAPLLDPDPLDEPLAPPEPELLVPLPASVPPPPEPLPLPASCPVFVDDDESPQPAASTIPSTPTPRRLRMAGEAERAARGSATEAARETLQVPGNSAGA
jgi:hypothetical protein